MLARFKLLLQGARRRLPQQNARLLIGKYFCNFNARHSVNRHNFQVKKILRRFLAKLRNGIQPEASPQRKVSNYCDRNVINYRSDYGIFLAIGSLVLFGGYAISLKISAHELTKLCRPKERGKLASEKDG